MTKPAVVWADEPTGNLDSRTASLVLDLFKGANEAGQTFVVVTHDPGLGATADRVVEVRRRERPMTIVAAILLILLLPHGLRSASATNDSTPRTPQSPRRRGEAVMVVGGAMLATSLITASFVIGDSFDQSIRTIAETQYGPIDEVAVVDGAGEAADLVAAIDSLRSTAIDGTMSAVRLTVAAGSTGPDRAVEPSVSFLELDRAQALAFGGDSVATGLSTWPADLRPSDVVINESLAADIGLSEGDAIDLFADGVAHTFTVAQVVPMRGLGGFGSVIGAPGSLTSQLAASDTVAQTLVLVSNTGDVYGGATRSGAVVAALDKLTPEGASVEPVKQTLLNAAETEGAETTNLFATIGGFSVIAGILLVVNLFAMLSAERRTDIGTMRAIGIKQGTIVRSFALEGAAYGLLAAIVGSLSGILVGGAVVAYANSTLRPTPTSHSALR
ncbi:MAG: FtsX-like permease family protein [Acidimicrobiales bacterium]